MEIAIIVAIAAAAGAAVLYPLLTSGKGGSGERLSEAALDEQVARYRDAIRRGTLCERCLSANAAGSRFCAECGRALTS